MPEYAFAMQTNIIWTGRFYHSIENCLVTNTHSGNEIVSTIIGNHEDRIFKVEYQIKTNKNWETTFLEMNLRLDNSSKLLILKKQDATWLLNDKPYDGLGNVFDVDISLSPFTNTLPINRLLLGDNERRVIEVLYFDILGKETKPVKQIYTRRSSRLYTYENFDKSFKADVAVDEQGLVVDYPELFEMTAKKQSNYR